MSFHADSVARHSYRTPRPNTLDGAPEARQAAFDHVVVGGQADAEESGSLEDMTREDEDFSSIKSQ